MPVTVNIKVDDQSLEKAFIKKGNEVNVKAQQLLSDLIDVAQMWVQKEAPRKTGRLKASVKKVKGGRSGYVFVSKNIAPYCDFVIDGTRPHDIVPKGKSALYWSGAAHPVKRVRHPGTKSNPFVDKSFDSMMGDVDRRIRVFEDWLVNV